MSDDLVLKFRFDDYFAKVDYLINHFNRMWTRFNFFLTIEGVVLSAIVLSGDGGTSLPPGIALLGLVMSSAWWVFGREDKYLVDLYRQQIKESYTALATHLGSQPPCLIGDSEQVLVSKDESVNAMWDRITRGRWNALSITRLPAAVPVVLIIFWLAALIWATVD